MQTNTKLAPALDKVLNSTIGFKARLNAGGGPEAWDAAKGDALLKAMTSAYRVNPDPHTLALVMAENGVPGELIDVVAAPDPRRDFLRQLLAGPGRLAEKAIALIRKGGLLLPADEPIETACEQIEENVRLLSELAAEASPDDDLAAVIHELTEEGKNGGLLDYLHRLVGKWEANSANNEVIQALLSLARQEYLSVALALKGAAYDLPVTARIAFIDSASEDLVSRAGDIEALLADAGVSGHDLEAVAVNSDDGTKLRLGDLFTAIRWRTATFEDLSGKGAIGDAILLLRANALKNVAVIFRDDKLDGLRDLVHDGEFKTVRRAIKGLCQRVVNFCDVILAGQIADRGGVRDEMRVVHKAVAVEKAAPDKDARPAPPEDLKDIE
jgi:hypothetical protein